MLGQDGSSAGAAEHGLRRVALALSTPAPGISEPQRWEQMDRGGFGTTIGHCDADGDVVGTELGIFGDHIEVAALIEDAGIDQLELGFELAAFPVLPNEPLVGEFVLRVLVEGLEV